MNSYQRALSCNGFLALSLVVAGQAAASEMSPWNATTSPQSINSVSHWVTTATHTATHQDGATATNAAALMGRSLPPQKGGIEGQPTVTGSVLRPAELVRVNPIAPTPVENAVAPSATPASAAAGLPIADLVAVPVEPVAVTQAIEASPADSSDPSATEPIWHFSFEPFVVVPVSADGNFQVNGIDVDVDLGLSDVARSLDNLNFAFLGKFEGWYGNQGFVIGTEYFAVGTTNTRDFNVPPRLQSRLPTAITADAAADILKVDLLYAYRFTDPPENGYGAGFTEFDLPPVTFDLMGGLRVYWLSQTIDLTSSLGGSASESSSYLIPEPVIRGRLRWNTSDTVALKLDANVSGFGIGDALTFSWSALAGVEWLFSGNTSITAGYQVNHIQFDADGGDDSLDLTAHGPYLSFSFRF